MMKSLRKGKKMLLILIIAVIVIIAAVFIIKGIVKNKPEAPETPQEEAQVIPLPETTYGNMEVRNIYMEYLKDDGKTMVTMEIENTTNKKVEDEHFNALLINANGEVIGTLPTHISKLDVGEQISVSVIYKGDLTATQQI